MKSVEFAGKTVEAATQNALLELNVTEDRVKVEVLDEGNKGFFKIGSRPAKIKVYIKKDYCYEAKIFLTDILNKMGFNVESEVAEEKDIVKIELKGTNMGILIGYRGETLDSLQYLVNLFINKGNDGKRKKVIIDAENYRAKREQTLRRLAKRVAYKVQKTKKIVKLEPMNPYERRIIHSALQYDKSIKTYSEGEEPYRRVVLDLKKA